MTQQQATPEEAKFEELKTEKPDKDAKPEQSTARDLGFLLDIPLALTVQLGKTKMLIKDLLQLGQGSIIELDKLAGEPMEILVNNKLVAKGEVVILNERLGIRLTDIISPTERIKQLK